MNEPQEIPIGTDFEKGSDGKSEVKNSCGHKALIKPLLVWNGIHTKGG